MTEMPFFQRAVIVGICAAGTLLTRFLPFIIFRSSKPVPEYIHYLGKALPSAIFAMLVVYCLKGVDVFQGSHGIPEFIGIFSTAILYIISKKNMMVAIAGGTAVYMLLVQFVF